MNLIGMTTQRISGFSEIVAGYRGVILDLWGVIHDGVTAAPGAVDAMRRLKVQGLSICLLSNSPRRASQVETHLAGMGIERKLYDHLVTSGELAFEALREPNDAWHARLGRHCFHLGPDFLAGLLEGTGRIIVEDLEEADFVVATGTDPSRSMADYESPLVAMIARNLPMICANPDLLVMAGDRRTLCAGSLAKRYKELGGEVRYHGKPHAGAYQRVMACLSLEPADLLAVGDSFRTDIAGANRAQIDAAFVVGGIHREELRLKSEEGQLDERRLAELAEESRAFARFTIPAFCW
jgi:HAD superfamily hydrolase (TIGR01459 family)